MDRIDPGIAHEQEAIAEFDKIKESFVQSSPTEEAELSSAAQDAPAAGRGLDDAYSEETLNAEAAAAAGTAAAGTAAAETIAETAAEAASEAPAPEAPAEADAAPETDAPAAEAEAETPAAEEAPEAGTETAAAAAAAGGAGMAAGTGRAAKAKKVKAPKEKKEKAPKEKKKKKKLTFGRVLLRIFLVLLVLILIGCGIAGYKIYQVIQEAPEINPSNIYDMLSEHSVIYDADGNVLTNLFEGDGLRQNIDYDKMPDQLKEAFLSIEDKTFWDHNGFNLIRIFGALWDTIRSGGDTRIRGTSTLSQQLARNIFMDRAERESRKLSRKIKEAYYTVIIERALSKEQILEAYLNTVYLGYNSYGVGAAARSYFDKDVSELNLIECATLASLPQNPAKYAPLKRIATTDVKPTDNYDVVSTNNMWTVYYNNGAEERTQLVLSLMHDQGKIDDATFETAKAQTVRPYIKPGLNVEVTMETTYMSDYVVSQVLAALQSDLELSYADAHNMLYNGGLEIHTTIDPAIQAILDEEYTKRENFPKVRLSRFRTDKNDNIQSDDRSRILLYNQKYIFDADGGFIIPAEDFERQANGDIKFLKNKRINIYRTTSASGEDVSVFVKDYYYFDEDGYMFSVNGTYWQIPSQYKQRDNDGNLIVLASYFSDFPNAFKRNDDGSLTLISSIIGIGSPVIQPQSAMTVIENSTGYVRGMIGGREIKGSLLFNRATAPRQTGSSIKPIAVYGPAIQKGYENSITGEGTIFTAAYAIDDAPTVRRGWFWPVNYSGQYTGIITLRDAVEGSVNTCAVNLFNQLDPLYCIEMLEKEGVTSLVKSGNENDINPGALALGGQTNGISPLDMTSAFSTFANYGEHIEATCFTKITNRRGDVIIDNTPEVTRVYDESVASLMINILRGVVTSGTGYKARLNSQPTAGKTGTTTDDYDAWFCGFTPKYSAALWIGCDVNLNLATTGGSAAAGAWGNIMERIGALDERGSFELRGNFVTVAIDTKTGRRPTELTPEEEIRSEIFINGTQPKDGGVRERILVCAESGYRATPECLAKGWRNAVQRPSGMSWEAMMISYGGFTGRGDENSEKFRNLVLDHNSDITEFYCPLHNPDRSVYPVSPFATSIAQYDTEGIEVITYSGPEWVWDGTTAAKAVFTEDQSGEKVEVVATVTSQTTEPTYEADGKTVYTASISFLGKDYTDTKTIIIPKKVDPNAGNTTPDPNTGNDTPEPGPGGNGDGN
ncbi:MAG: transglycosylase domain-containing protein [Firmicutes bacterium]|nr:transglycosylase domain-containing protein [Bacillota bacterium]